MSTTTKKLDSIIYRLDQIYQDLHDLGLSSTLECYQFELAMRESIAKAYALKKAISVPESTEVKKDE